MNNKTAKIPDDSGRPKSEWEQELERIQIGNTTIEYLKEKRVTSFTRAIAMKKNNWDRLVDESGGNLQQPDVLVISDLARYHVHKRREDWSFTYQDFDEWDFIQFQTNDTGTPNAGQAALPQPQPQRVG